MKINKKLLHTISCLGLSALLFSASAVGSSTAAVNVPDIKDAGNISYHGIYKNKEVSLKDGKWSGSPFVKGGNSRPAVGLIKDFSFTGDIDGDGTDEHVVFLWESSGGSGTQVYMAILGSHNGKSLNLSTHLIGDRVQLRMGRVNQGKIELDVIQAGESDAACCPTEKVLRTWSLKNKQLIEHKTQFLGHLSLIDLERVEWSLTHMNWRETLPENTRITLTVDGDKVSGKSACNRYFASIKAGKMPGEVVISQAGSTRMACHNEAMELESRFLKSLSNVVKYSFVNGKLALSYKDGDAFSTLLFTAQIKY